MSVYEFEFPIESSRIREFALSIGAPDPWTGRAAAWMTGEDGPVASLIFTEAHRWYMSLDDRNRALGLTLDPRRMVHGEQRYFYERLPIAGEVLHGAIRVLSDEQRQGKRGGTMRLINLETLFTDATGAPVVRSECLLIEVGQAAAPSTPVAPALQQLPESELVFDAGPIERVHIARYGGAAGDFHPAHFDDAYGGGGGAAGVFVMGMLPGAHLAQFVRDAFGNDAAVSQLTLRFMSKVWPGDIIRCTGILAPDDDGGVRLDIELWRRPKPRPDEPAENIWALGGELAIRASAVATGTGIQEVAR